MSDNVAQMTDSAAWRAKWGDRVLGDVQAPMTGAAFHDLVEALPIEDKPIGVALDPQTLGRLYADRTSPYVFQQFLLEQLKQVGCTAVEGTIKFKLTRGKVFKLKARPGEMMFRYVWLAGPLCAALGVEGDDKISLKEA